MNKTFRINVVATYFKEANINQYRQPILNIFTSLAWLYHLEYAFSINHKFTIEEEEEESDLIYLRSTKETRISKKELSDIISNLFRNGLSFIYEGVDVGRQLYRALPQYPFPPVYYRPLNYPYVEFHNANESTLCIWEEALQKISDIVEDAHNSNSLLS